MMTQDKHKIAEVTGSLFNTQLALHEVSASDLLKKATPRELDLMVKKMRHIKKTIDLLLGK